MLRCIGAVICGAIAGGVFNMALVLLSWKIYPPPEGANMSDPATMKAYIQSLPTAAFLLILVAHAGGALVGGLVAGLIARQAQLVVGASVGALFLIGGIMNVISIPAPLWFAVIDLISYIPSGMVGARLVPNRTVATAIKV